MEETSPNLGHSSTDDRLEKQVEQLRNEVFKPEPLPERTLPWFIDIFLYPISIAGLVHLSLFVLIPSLISLFTGLLGSFLVPYLREGTGYMIGWLTIPLYAVLYCYFLYYLGHCIIDSAKGQIRAPDVTTEDFGFDELFSRVIVFFGCAAVCFWPAAVYYILIKKTDGWYWLLCGCGAFVLPISLLIGILFDALDALNPIKLVCSICRTLFNYLKLFILLCVICGPAIVVLSRVLHWAILARVVEIYLCFVAMHLIGRFYWQNKAKLGWEV